MALQDIRILVALDFGTTYSGFAYVHKENPDNIETNHTWPGREGVFKTPTALLYNETYTQVKSWGDLALEEEPEYMVDDSEERSRPIELFKLHISDLKDNQKPWLPSQLNYKKAIEDYLTQMQILIKSTLERRWPAIRFPQQVGFVLTIPAEWPNNTTGIMRECAYKAGLLSTLNSAHLEFTTEPEAAALYCLNVVKEHNLHPGDSFLVADCGGGTVDITSRKLLHDNKLSEITERIGDLCGSTFVDKEFLQFLGRKVGFQALETLKRCNYGQMQHLIQQFFCNLVKFKFKGDPTTFKPMRLILHRYCPDLQEYVTGELKEKMEEAGWIVKLDFESVKGMFDPVVDKVIKLIDGQLKETRDRCSAMFLVGGFSESPYLLNRVRETFRDQVPIIAVPALPIAAVVRGAVAYGLNVEIVQERVLKWTYGIEVCRSWVSGKDKKNRRTHDGLIFYFYKLAQRRTKVDVDRKFSGEFSPVRADQTHIVFNVYYTRSDFAKYCNESGMKLLGTLRINTPDTHFGLNRQIEFSLTFAKMEIKATAKNKRNGKTYDETTFELDI
ncbi:unnamed protein product [Rhizophagus irregularis]|uniref:Actin-like ATPase domain-containing protein n=1 Tax=Rhizophagus irregularis TaxID=588596 RepID=A0A2I1GLB5_9GLOM|nr:hypothetical protein RhiirA4_403405 [Rhizophagus irregularis]CAB4438817.1 unnamed protein product [Rhizophagus irregularis]CAB4438866.1 unnamed protein product [Rhizophagus irregularis]